MKQLTRLLLSVATMFFTTATALYATPLEVVAEFPTRPANPAVGADGTVYVTMHPFDKADYKVMAIRNQQAEPYPNAAWTTAPDAQGVGISNTIGIHVTAEAILWVLDLGDEQHSPKLFGWDTQKNTLHRILYLPQEVSLSNSLHQDFAIDTERNVVYIADMTRNKLVDSSEPALVIVDLQTGQARRVLQGHALLQPQGDDTLHVNEKPLLVHSGKGEPQKVQLGLNPIAIDANNEWVYFSTISAGNVYRVRSADLSNPVLDDAALVSRIEVYGPKPGSDGIAAGRDGRIYITDVTHNAIGVTTAGRYEILVQDARLAWPDGLFIAADGYIYVTVAQLHLLPVFQADGKDHGEPPYLVLRMKVE